jgi:hypothetical protein
LKTCDGTELKHHSRTNAAAQNKRAIAIAKYFNLSLKYFYVLSVTVSGRETQVQVRPPSPIRDRVCFPALPESCH